MRKLIGTVLFCGGAQVGGLVVTGVVAWAVGSLVVGQVVGAGALLGGLWLAYELVK